MKAAPLFQGNTPPSSPPLPDFPPKNFPPPIIFPPLRNLAAVGGEDFWADTVIP